MTKNNAIPKVKNEKESLKDDVQEIMNVVKDEAIKEGVIDKSPQILIRDVDYTGKKLKVSKSFYKNGKQSTLEAGTKWEDISPFFRRNIVFSKKDFI